MHFRIIENVHKQFFYNEFIFNQHVIKCVVLMYICIINEKKNYILGKKEVYSLLYKKKILLYL